MAELEAATVVADTGATAEVANTEEPDVESWIALTQNGLGRLVEKPRLMADRLRKPPFRFLFDVSVEVARQTGFGLSELFNGSLSEKPKAPSSREEKITFLEQWVHLVQWALGPPFSGDLMAVSPANIVCGVKPEWTNFLLQCTAAAAWPSECAVIRPSSPAPPVVATHEVQLPPEPAPATSAEQPAVAPAGHDEALPTPEAQEPPAVVEQAPLVIEPEITVEQAREIAAGMDFRTTLNQFNTVHQEWTSATAEFPMPPGQSGAETSEEPVQESENPEGEQTEGESAARAPLKQAAARTTYINEEMRRAEELLNQMEEGFDRREEEFMSKKRQLEEKQRREQEEAEAREREAVEAEEAAAREAERLKEEKAARKAARKAEKERLAAEEAAKPVYPVSKHSAENGARLVSCVGDDEEYEWDGDEGAEEEVPEAEERDEKPLEGAAAFDLSSALAEDPNPPSSAFGGQILPGVGGSLFDKLKLQLKETFVSYLCASMPETLLKHYKPGEVVACLQFLLKELRRNITQHCFEDVGEEEPTSIAEGLREKFPSDWLTYLQDGTPAVFVQQYDVPELIDTLQSLSQTCLERLEDNLGPLQSWLEESSPLRYVPPAEPTIVEVETPKGEREDGFAMATTSVGMFTAELAPAPWEEPAPTVSVTSRTPAYGGGGLAATVSDFRHRVPSPSAVSSHPPPAFDSTLGPAIWEQSSAVSYPATSAGPNAPRYAQTAIGGRAVHTAMAHPGGGSSHPTTSSGVRDYRGRPMTHLGGHVIASR
jgi:hypothetical protein